MSNSIVKRKKRKDLQSPLAFKILAHTILSLGGILMLYPFVYQIMAAFSTYSEYLGGGFLPIPKHIGEVKFRNFAWFFKIQGVIPAIWLTAKKIIFYSVMTVSTTMLAGFLFQKYYFKFKRTVFMLFMISMMIPGIVTMVPSLVIMVNFPLAGGNDILGQGGSGLMNNPASNFVFGWIAVYNIFLVKQALTTIPDSFGEAAEIDGAGFLRIVFGIYMPMILPVMAILMLGILIGQWNDYMFPMLYLSDNPEAWTIGYKVYRMLSIFNMGAQPDFPAIFGIYSIYMIFPILVFLFLQKYFIAGLTLGGIKE